MADKASPLLSRDEILSGRGFRTEDVEAGGGRKIRLRHLTASEMIALGSRGQELAAEIDPNNPAAVAERSKDNITTAVRLVRKLMVDERGDSIFPDATREEEEVESLLDSFDLTVIFDGFRRVVTSTSKAMAAVGEQSA